MADGQVDPVKVINALKTRLAEEIVQRAIVEAALQDSQERERSLARKLKELKVVTTEANDEHAAS